MLRRLWTGLFDRHRCSTRFDDLPVELRARILAMAGMLSIDQRLKFAIEPRRVVVPDGLEALIERSASMRVFHDNIIIVRLLTFGQGENRLSVVYNQKHGLMTLTSGDIPQGHGWTYADWYTGETVFCRKCGVNRDVDDWGTCRRDASPLQHPELFPVDEIRNPHEAVCIRHTGPCAL